MDSSKNLIVWLLRQSRECEWIEFKESYHSPDETGETISALANGACLHEQPHGYLVFGINDRLEIIGTSFDFSSTKKGNELIEHWIIQRLSPKIDFRIRREVVDGKSIVIIEIPAARNQPVAFIHEGFIRIGSITRKLREFPEKERKIWSKRADSAFVNETARGDLDGQDIVDLLSTQEIFELLKLPYPSERHEVISRLKLESLVREEKGRYSITNLGAVLFAKRLSQFSTIARKAPRIIIYAGKNKLKTTRDMNSQEGYAIAFEHLINYISDHLPANEEISKVIRESVTMYPKDAIREIVANALVHQDFSEFGTGPVVEIYADRIEVTNPGLPLITPLRFIDGYKSRNELLASLMRRLGICEERGSGVDRIIALSELYQLPAPDFRVLENQTQVILYAHRKLGDMDRQDKIRACYQHCTLRYISNDHMTNQSLRERFKIESKNAAIASRIIGDTLDAGLIKLEDPNNKSRKYVKYIPSWA